MDIPTLALLAALLTIIVALYIPYRNASRAAAANFRNLLLAKLSGLYPVPNNWPNNIDLYLKSIFPELQATVEQFKPYVAPWRRRAFERDWLAFYCSTGRDVDKNCQVYHHYMDFTSPDQQIPSGKQTFHKNVSRLLSYAREP